MNLQIFAKIISRVSILYIIILIAINYSTPIGLHVSIAITGNAGGGKTFEERFYDLFFWRTLSSMIVKENKNKCDLPRAEYYNAKSNKIDLTKAIFSKENIPGKNERIAFLASSHNQDGFNSDLIFEYILDSIKFCDINHSLINGYSSIAVAIFSANIEIVSLLVSKNVDLEKKIDRPGKSIDGLYPLDFAKLLEAKTKAEEKRLAYREIISIIQEKIKERSASTTIEIPTQ